VAFTGDVGRRDPPLLTNAAAVPSADLLLCESTNGGRHLESVSESVARLEQIVRRALDADGRVVIPTFSLGRMQVVAYCLEQAMRAGRLPAVRIYVDSVLGEGIAEVYHRRLGYDWESRVRFIRSAEEARQLAVDTTPSIVLAPGGMADGRVARYIRDVVDDPRCAVVLVSYQAPETLGRRLLTPGPRVRIQGKSFNRWADIVQLTGFSGHADHDELVALLRGRASQFTQVRLVHGELDAAHVFAHELVRLGYRDVAVAERGEPVVLS
jgi:metallo-beta-lactamase family protein